jgi:hypothetical protein
MPFHFDFSEAPLAHRHQRDQIDADSVTVLSEPGIKGAAARFRKLYGFIGEFIVVELQRDPDNGINAAAAGLGPNFANAIVNLAMNSEAPETVAEAFLNKITRSVRKELRGMIAGESRDESFVTVGGRADNRVVDWDFREEMKDKER